MLGKVHSLADINFAKLKKGYLALKKNFDNGKGQSGNVESL